MKSKIISAKVEEFILDRRKSNNIVDVWNLMKENEKNIIPCILALEKVFRVALEKRWFHTDENLKLTNMKGWEIENEYTKWLREAYEKTLINFYDMMSNKEDSIKKQALTTICNLIRAEKKFPIGAGKGLKLKSEFPVCRLEEVIKKLLSPSIRNEQLIMEYEEYVANADFFYYTWKILKEGMPTFKEEEENDVLWLNVIHLLEKIAPPKAYKKKSKKEMKKTNIEDFGFKEVDSKLKCLILDVFKFTSTVWQNLLRKKSSLTVRKKLLILLLEKYIFCFENPLFLTDFLMDSLNVSGAVSILALQAISVLMQNYNLECPNVFGKLYNLFRPEIFYTNYTSRLFYLADIFLSSTYLPETLTASFAKRIARLTLVVPAPNLIVMLRFVGNVILRNPGLKVMIHNLTGDEVTRDPYLMEEPDPMKSKALESSLWEIGLLKNHVLPSVASAAKFIDSDLPEVEYDLTPVLDYSWESALEEQKKKKLKTALTFAKPDRGISRLQDDALYKMWSLK